jgi:hypothetical protein
LLLGDEGGHAWRDVDVQRVGIGTRAGVDDQLDVAECEAGLVVVAAE